jgi:hypothetical protein
VSFFKPLTSFLKKHPGHVHFATDTWTSPNHHAFVVWTVHLHHKGHILTFLLDIMEVPEVRYVLQLRLTLLIVALQSHTGDALARAFHKMLVEHGLTQKVSMMAPAPLPLLTSDLDLDIC